MLTLILLLACGQPTPAPAHAPPPPLILNGRDIAATLPPPGKMEFLEFHDCPVETITVSLGWPLDYFDDGGMSWTNFRPHYELAVLPLKNSVTGCKVRIYTPQR